jgi:hypothetical protein
MNGYSYQEHRDRFLVDLCSRGFSRSQVVTILRNSQTINRLEESQCNGGSPAQDPNWTSADCDRYMAECVECGDHWQKWSLTRAGICKVCRAHARVRAILPEGWRYFTPSLCPVLYRPDQTGDLHMISSEGVHIPLRPTRY